MALLADPAWEVSFQGGRLSLPRDLQAEWKQDALELELLEDSARG